MLARAEAVDCPDCNGTGAEQPDCWVCKGRRTIHWRRAIQYGVKKADLIDLEDDGYCECPRCRAASCEICQGDGTIPPAEMLIQEERVLLTGFYDGDLYPEIREHPRRVYLDCNAVLSPAAHRRLFDADQVGHRISSIFCDSFSLREAGWRRVAAMFQDGDPAWPAFSRDDTGCDRFLSDDGEYRGAELARYRPAGIEGKAE